MGFEKFHDDDIVLLLKKCLLYGLKQAAMAFYRKLLTAASKIGLKHSSADPCLYYKWEGKRMVIMTSWIDGNIIVGPSDLVLRLKSNLIEQFECNNCGVLTEYIGNKIEQVGEDAIRLVQTVLTQSYEDEFELGNRCYNTAAQPGMVLMHPVEGKEVLKPEDQTALRSGVGKLMYQTQYLRPDIAQEVQYLARYMSCGNLKMLEVMKRCMGYILFTKETGLLLKPSHKWNGYNKHQFCIRGKSDSDYAKDTQTRYSVSGYAVYFEDALTMHRNAAQKTVASSSCKAELNASVLCVQGMMYQRNMLESIGLKVELPMILEMDNKGAVNLVNSFSVEDCT